MTEVSYHDPSRLWLISVQIGPTVRSDALREAWKERWGPAEVKVCHCFVPLRMIRIVAQDAKRKKASEGHQFLKDEQVKLLSILSSSHALFCLFAICIIFSLISSLPQIHNTATKVHIELSVDPQKSRAAAGVTNPKKVTLVCL